MIRESLRRFGELDESLGLCVPMPLQCVGRSYGASNDKTWVRVRVRILGVYAGARLRTRADCPFAIVAKHAKAVGAVDLNWHHADVQQPIFQMRTYFHMGTMQT